MKSPTSRLVLLSVVATAFLVGYGAVAKAWPTANITRSPNFGYFLNHQDTDGTNVWPASGGAAGCAAGGGNAIPTTVDTASEFVNFVKCKLNNGNAQEKTGAAFIIQTMIGNATNKPPTAAQLTKWSNDVSYSASKGWINFGATNNFSFTVNTYYQGTGAGFNYDDDAFFVDSGSDPAITFKNSAGTIVYAIRRQCANPVGNSNFANIPDSPTFNVSGTTVVDNRNPVPGATIQFTHTLTTDAATSPSTISWTTQSVTSSGTVLSTISSGNAGALTPGPGQSVGPESYVVPAGTPAGTQICRWVTWTPDTAAGGTGTSAMDCATVQYNFTLAPSINVSSGGNPITGAVEQGDVVTFTYAVANGGTTVSQNASCTIYGVTRNGYTGIPTPNDSTSDVGYTAPATGCPRTFPAGSNTTIATENVTASTVNKTICRSLFISPISQSNPAAASVEACVPVGAKPYVRVYGGDVSAGNGFGASCASNPSAAIVGWNKESATYSGAGTQYAMFALNKIYDFAGSLGNSGGAPVPDGLAFAHNGIVGGLFGGSLGAVPCMSDFYAAKPSSAAVLAATDITSLSTGAYALTTGSGTTLKGALGAGKRISIFVQGDVLIDGNITYPANWTAGATPLLQLVVKGNIFVSQSVTQIDGVYIAQPAGTGGGAIYTCADPTLPASAVLTDRGTLYGLCKNKLTINGVFAANQVQFLRTNGTLSQSSAAETAASGAGAEVFNFSPAVWMAYPPGQAQTNDYDSIVSLPPIL